MLRELIQQIELEKLAEQDPDAFYNEVMKLAFFDELSEIEKEAGLKEIGKSLIGGARRLVTGQPKPRAPLKMSYQGAAKSAPAPKVSVDPVSGAKTTSTWDPGTSQWVHTKTAPSVAERAAAIPQSWAHNPNMARGVRAST
jgi:hypothetical protein